MRYFNLIVLLLGITILMSSCDEQKQFIKLQENLQERLDNGELPSQIVNSDKKVEASDMIGLTFGGGVIFEVNTGQLETKIVAFEDLPVEAPWGCKGTTINPVGGCSDSYSCTQAIVEEGCLPVSNAAQLCNDLVLAGFDDWLLPTEIDYDNMVYGLFISIEGRIPYGYHWTSSEVNADNAMVMERDSYGGGSGGVEKDNNYPIRPVRYFYEQ